MEGVDMSWVAWLIVVQLLLVAGFVASTIVFLVGIFQRVHPSTTSVIPTSDEPSPRTASLPESTHRWHLAEPFIETITG